MIRFENISKSFWVNGRRRVIIEDVDFVIPSGRAIGLLGKNGAGKSTLLKIVSGALRPDKGRVVSDGSISWPVGLSGAFHPELTGAQNVRFLARVYGVDTHSLENFVRDFAELGPFFNMPMRSYSSGMRSRVTFGTAMGIKFDTYLIDEVTAVGDASFRHKSKTVFLERVRNSGAIMVSHNMNELRNFCNSGAILNEGKLQYFEDIEEAITEYERLQQG